jgi:uncharacterized membrane protein YcaP (DUF421 family)
VASWWSLYSRHVPSLPELGSSLPDVALRTAIVYLFLIVAIRVSGKREVGQMSVLELIVVLIISDAVQNSMVGDNTSIWGGLVAVVVLLGLDFILRELSRRSRRVRVAVEGEPRLLVRGGRVLDRALREEGLEMGDLESAVRAHGVARIADVDQAVLETDGTISVIARQQDDESGSAKKPPDRPDPTGRAT